MRHQSCFAGLPVRAEERDGVFGEKPMPEPVGIRIAQLQFACRQRLAERGQIAIDREFQSRESAPGSVYEVHHTISLRCRCFANSFRSEEHTSELQSLR